MKILLVWENIPEETRVYVLDVSEEELPKIASCHGRYGGQVGNTQEYDDAISALSDRLRSMKQWLILPGIPLGLGDVDYFVHTGWLM